MWISSSAPAYDTDVFSYNRNLITVKLQPGDAPGGWQLAAPQAGVYAHLSLAPGLVGGLISDCAFDIALANGPALTKIMAGAIARNGLPWLYLQKVEFARTFPAPTASVYGPIAEDASYVSFAAILRRSLGPFPGDPDFIREVCRCWDRFVVERLGDFIPAGDARVENLLAWPKIGRQLDATALSRKLDEAVDAPGTYFLLRIGKAPTEEQGRIIEGLLNIEPKIGKFCVRQVGDQANLNLRRLITEDVLQPCRFYVPDNRRLP